MVLTVWFQRDPQPALSSFQKQNTGFLSFSSSVEEHVSETECSHPGIKREGLSWIQQTQQLLTIQQQSQLTFHLRIEKNAVPATMCSFFKTR
jgi:hypothetical protein